MMHATKRCSGTILTSAVLLLIGLLLGTNAVAATKKITSTIVVNEGQTYDGGGQTIVASGMGDGGQDEGQKPIFKLMKGAKLKNVRIAKPGCDGVHCYGNNTIENVVWEDVGEDALTVKGGDSAGSNTVTIIGGSASYASDKVFQLNAPVTFKVSNFKAVDMGKLVRQNGDTTFQCKIYLNNVSVDKASDCVARTDSSSTQLYYDTNCSFKNVSTLWKFPSTSQIHKVTAGSSSSSSTSGTSSNIQTGVNYKIINRHSGKLLEVQNAAVADGANVAQWSSNGHNCQIWRLEDAGSGYFRVKNVNSGKYLEVAYADTNDGANIAQWANTGHNCQHWRFQGAGDGYYIFINRNSGKAMDVLNWSTADGANVMQWSNHGGANQQWKFSK